MNATVHSLLSEHAKTATWPLVFPSNRKPGERFLGLKRGFKTAVQRAGIDHIRQHDLRHTFATRLVRAGVDIVTVRAFKNYDDGYAHALADVKMAAVSRLDSAGVRSLPDSTRTPSPLGASSLNPVEMVLLHEHRPVAQLVRALP